MRRWVLSAAIVALLGAAAAADDRQPAKSPKVIRVLVLEDAQPLPADASSAAAGAAVVIDGSANTGSSCADGKGRRHTSKIFSGSKKEDCEGCASLRYYNWFIFSSCRSFFNEGPYAPRYPDKCPGCCPRH